MKPFHNMNVIVRRKKRTSTIVNKKKQWRIDTLMWMWKKEIDDSFSTPAQVYEKWSFYSVWIRNKVDIEKFLSTIETDSQWLCSFIKIDSIYCKTKKMVSKKQFSKCWSEKKIVVSKWIFFNRTHWVHFFFVQSDWYLREV